MWHNDTGEIERTDPIKTTKEVDPRGVSFHSIHEAGEHILTVGVYSDGELYVYGRSGLMEHQLSELQARRLYDFLRLLYEP